MFRLSGRSRRNLVGVHPRLVRVVERAIEITSVDFTVIEGVRTDERQRMLFDAGKSRTLNSRHLIQPDGYGWAVDLMAAGDLDGDGDVDPDDARRAWEQAHYVAISDAMMRAAEEQRARVRWGGTFAGFVDSPHFQLER